MDDETRQGEIRVIDDAPAPSGPRHVIPDEPGFFRKNFGAIIWALILILLAVFIGQNWRDVKVEAYFWSFTIQLSWALIVAALVGVILGWLVPLVVRRRKREP